MTISIQTIIILIIIGVLAGILSGIAGVGGGIIMVPLIIFFLGVSQLEAQGTSLAVLLPPTGIMAATVYYKQGYINWKFALIIALGFLIGGFIGGKIALKLNPNILRKVFGILLLAVSIKLLLKK